MGKKRKRTRELTSTGNGHREQCCPLPAATGRQSTVASLKAGLCEACMKQLPNCGRELARHSASRHSVVKWSRPTAGKNIHIHTLTPFDCHRTPDTASDEGAPPRLLRFFENQTWITTQYKVQTFDSPFQDPLAHSFLPCQRLTVPFGRIALPSRPLVRPLRHKPHHSTKLRAPCAEGSLARSTFSCRHPRSASRPFSDLRSPSFMNLRFPGAREAGSHHVERK